jgi:nucleotide-binding universal stress UspA family protein
MSTDIVLCAVDLGWRNGAPAAGETEATASASIRPEVTASGEAALRAAVREAKLAGAALVVIHALPMDPGAPMWPEGAQAALIAREEMASLVSDVVLEAIGRLGDGPPDGVPVLIEDGPAGQAILDAARRVDAELIVVGNIGARGLGDALLGSVASAVVREAPCSVLVVRPPDGRPAGGARPM